MKTTEIDVEFKAKLELEEDQPSLLSRIGHKVMGMFGVGSEGETVVEEKSETKITEEKIL